MSGRLVLVTGGARSGKSEFAERYALHYSPKCAYIATAEILDAEMAERVRLHRARRQNGRWTNYEAPRGAEKIFAQLDGETRAALFDCLTIYTANLFFSASGENFSERAEKVLAQIGELVRAAQACGKIVVMVTNEVGCGIVPENQLAREYRDLAGWANQKVAAAADEVYFCVAGQAVDVKKMSFRFPDERD